MPDRLRVPIRLPTPLARGVGSVPVTTTATVVVEGRDGLGSDAATLGPAPPVETTDQTAAAAVVRVPTRPVRCTVKTPQSTASPLPRTPTLGAVTELHSHGTRTEDLSTVARE